MPGRGVAGDQGVDERVDDLGVGQPEQVADARPRRSSPAPTESSWSSIDSASRMPPAASRAIRWTRRGIGRPAVGLEDPGELALDLGDRQAADVEALEARQDRRREARRLGRGEHEDDEVGRLLERLEERVPGVLGDLVRLVEDVDLASQFAGRVGEALAELADVVDAAVAGGVDLDEVERRALADRDARRAGVAGVAVLEVRAVERLGEDPRQRRLAGAARPDEQDGVRDPIGADGVAQRLDDRFLPDDLARRSGRASGGRGPGAGRLRSRPPPVAGERELKCRAPSVDRDVPVPTMTSGSDQAVPRHPAMIA